MFTCPHGEKRRARGGVSEIHFRCPAERSASKYSALGDILDSLLSPSAEEVVTNWAMTQDQLERLLESIPAGIIKIDPEGYVTFANAAALGLLGYESQELLGTHLHNRVHYVRTDGQHLEYAECPVYLSQTTGTMLPMRDDVFWRKDKTPISVEGVIAPIWKGQDVIGTVLFFEDTSEKKNLREKMQGIYSTAADAYLFFDKNRKLVDCNLAVKRFFGVEIDAFMAGFDDFATINELEKDTFASHLDTAFSKGSTSFTWNWKDDQGRILPSSVSMVRIFLQEQPAILASVQDLRSLREAEHSAELERQRLAHIIRASPVGVCLLFDGKIQNINPHMTQLYPVDAGGDFLDLLHREEDKQLFIDHIDAGEPILDYELTLCGHENTVRHGILSAQPVEWSEKNGFICWLVDITPLKKTEQDLLQAKEKAEEATLAKSNFMDRMSHEIRTPMNAILGMSYLIRQSGLSDQQMEHMGKIQAAANSLLELINNILEFSTLESGVVEASRAPFELSMLLEDTLESPRELAGHKHLGWTVHIADDVPKSLVGDAPRLGQVLSILSGNALKFTEKGDVRIDIARESEASEHTQLRFSVRDTGIGMKPEQLEHVFLSFTQADGSLTRRYGGTGLGLSIARHLVDIMGGRMWAESVEGEGSTFHCVLPFGATASYMAMTSTTLPNTCGPGSHAEASTQTPRVPHILLVEDNDINQEIACELLKGMNLEVTVAENGAEALKTASASRFDMIFMDIQMPVMDGLEATRRIRNLQEPWAQEIPIIAMTAHALSDDRDQSLSAGMNAHLTKPINPEALQRVIAIWLPDSVLVAPKAATHSVATPVAGQALDLSSLHGVNITSGISNVAGNEALYLDLLRRFAAKYRNSHHELPALLKEHETESAARLAHTIKGVAANLGATRVANVAKDIESAILADNPIDVLLGPYAIELGQVTQSIDQLILSRDAQEESASYTDAIDAAAIPHILDILRALPTLMQTDWGQAQDKIDELNPLLSHTFVGEAYARLRNALEEFDIVDFANSTRELRELLTAAKKCELV